MRSLLAAFGVFLSVGISAAEPTKIDWSELVDHSARSFEDPYRDLSIQQLTTLRKYFIAQERLASSAITETERPELEARLANARATLEADGINPDWLISQRWIVAERRKNAMTAANAALDGTEIILYGYAIPAPREKDGKRVAYLVPARGMCSHTPPPPPNQLVRLLLDGDWSPTMMHEPVVATGRLSIDPTTRQLNVVDGFMILEAAFSMDVSKVNGFGKPQKPAPFSNEWAAGIAEKIRRTKKLQPDLKP